MSHAGHARFERVIVEHYEGLKAEVLGTVRGKLAVDRLHPDSLDLDAAYNAAWHALYERSLRETKPVSNLGGWLATICYRRAIDDIRSAQIKHRAAVATGQTAARDSGYEPDVDGDITDRQRYHQWLMSVRLRLNAREQRAVSLCVLHEYSRRDASDIMGIDAKRLDKIMVAANKKLGGLLEAINRGDWCLDQRSLIKAYAFGLHDEGGERHALAVHHLMQCQACAAYVRSLRGLAGIMPPPGLLAAAVGAGGGILGALTASFKGSASGGVVAGAGTAAGGGGATVLGSIGAKSAAVCVSAACAAGGVVVVVDSAPNPARPPSESRSATPSPAGPRMTAKTPATRRPPKPQASASPSKRATPDARTKVEQQQLAEFDFETQINSTPESSKSTAASVPRPAAGSEFDFEGP